LIILYILHGFFLLFYFFFSVGGLCHLVPIWTIDSVLLSSIILEFTFHSSVSWVFSSSIWVPCLLFCWSTWNINFWVLVVSDTTMELDSSFWRKGTLFEG
jgi:hypothetical protein